MKLERALELKSKELGNSLIQLKRKNEIEYFELRHQLILELGQDFYDKYLSWHETQTEEYFTPLENNKINEGD